MKKHNIIIERWAGIPGPRELRDEPCFRWTVSYDNDGRWYSQGFEDTHADARAAAEDFLRGKGIDLDWLPPKGASVRLLTPRSKRPRA